MKVLQELKEFWRTLVFLLTPIIFLPLIILIPGTEAACGYGVIIMAVYWLTEALPIAVTAFLPMVLFPLLGVMGAKDVSINYMKDTNFVFMGGLMMALSLERSNLHSRLALNILKVMGTRSRWLLLGFMLPTWFLSMWISNTATTAMMIPVAEAVIQKIRIGLTNQSLSKTETDDSKIAKLNNVEFEKELNEKGQGYINRSFEMDNIEIESTHFGREVILTTIVKPNAVNVPSLSPQEEIVSEQELTAEKCQVDLEYDEQLDRKFTMFSKMLSLCICYSANVGGTATLTGTGPNMVLAGLTEEIWSSHGLPTPITWASWIPLGLPAAVICLILGWLWLQFYFLGGRNFCCCCAQDHDIQSEEKIKEVISDEYDKLGPMKFSEYANTVFFVTLVFLWFIRDPGFVPGYASLFKSGYVTDAVPAMLIAILLFAFPRSKPKSGLCCKPGDEAAESVLGLLDWPLVSRKLPWGPIFVLGGGFALADAMEKSGLSDVIAEAMTVFSSLPPWVMVLLVTTLVAMLTEITSNSATTTLFLPILASLAEAIGVNPLYLMLPATLAASLAFMLPVATPPNAIVFSYGHLKVVDMAKAGLMMNFLGILVVTMGTHTWAMAILDLHTIPWSNGTNTT